MAPANAASAPANPAAVSADASWIMQALRPDGAIGSSIDAQHINPYLANFAAAGLARAATVTGNGAYLGAAWAWLAWYQAHEDPHGFVTDYTVTAGTEVSTGDFDSTDAYAGTFLLGAQAAWSASHDLGRLATLHGGIAGAVRAIAATTDTDGLTWAKPAWHVKYLMDQAETYAGLRAAANVASALGDPGLAADATARAATMKAAVARLWNPASGSFDWAVHGDGAHQTTSWAQLYPDAMEQIWPVAMGLVDGARAQQVAATFVADHPAWNQPQAIDVIDGASKPIGFWVVPALAMGAVGGSASSSASPVRAAAVGTGRAWPFTTGDAGNLILAESGSTPGKAAFAEVPAAVVAAAAARPGAGAPAGGTGAEASAPSAPDQRPPTADASAPVSVHAAAAGPSGADGTSPRGPDPIAAGGSPAVPVAVATQPSGPAPAPQRIGAPGRPLGVFGLFGLFAALCGLGWLLHRRRRGHAPSTLCGNLA